MSAPPTGADRRGFTLLELVVVVIIVCILILVAMAKMWDLQASAERATMAYNVGALRSALALHFAAAVVGNDTEGLGSLTGSNPMALLNQRPGNYLGEFEGVDPATLEAGNWYFDRRQKMLIYLIGNDHFFHSPLAGPPRVRWAVRLDFADQNGNGAYEPQVDQLEGVSLVPAEEYQWRRGDKI
jgi:general secretion pathway protein G